MNDYLGTWKLETNENFDNFLKYIGYSWLKRKAALLADIDASFIQKNSKFFRQINSTFLKEEEEYIFNNEYYETPYKLYKKHGIINDKVITEVKKVSNPNITWREEVYIINNKLILIRFWLEREKIQVCKQNFVRY